MKATTTTTTTMLLRVLLWLGASMNALGAEVWITSVDDFIQFKDNVSGGTTYSGTTVFLDSDLSLAGKSFEPIGTSNYFNGTFDGQGHVISNLAMNSSSQYAGLFGYSGGLTIKNVILDSSCSITSSYDSSGDANIGGIIGYCYAYHGPCTIENSVNMGSVSFSGSITGDYLYLGGIVGYLSSRYFDSTVKNCANYGDITHTGESSRSYIGGIVGYSYGSSYNIAYIYNCLNHGTITHSSTLSSWLYLGGIAGETHYMAVIENCVSGGKISLLTNSGYIGSIAGYIDSETFINYTYFISDLSGYKKYGEGTPSEFNTLSYDNASFELSETVSIGDYSGTSLIDVLNGYAYYYTLRDYSRWLLNEGDNAVTFTINGNSPFALNSQIILLPSLASEGNMSFDGWYTDEGLTTPFTEFEVTSDTELYGRFEKNTNSYTISFETRREGVSVASITAKFNSVVTLQSGLKKNDCSLAFWENKYGDYVGLSLVMPSHNITLYAVWGCTRIKTPEDFAIFTDGVNKRMNYSGMTVFLDSDLSLAGKSFEPIGTSNYFNGTFDGQGHVISNLKVTSSSRYAGLLGYSEGPITIKNVILDSSCSITSSYSDYYDVYIGGIIGECWATNGPCTIENSVNMGSVAFGGNGSLYLGGLVGHLYSSNYDSTVKNCANYGNVTYSGKSSYNSYIGGIIGNFRGDYSSRAVYIYNCLNHGTITHNGTSYYLYIGGIAGKTSYTTIENCVSGGKFSLLTTASSENYIGRIVGEVYYVTSINYAYFTSELSGYKKYGDGTPSSEFNTLSYDSTSFELNGTVSIGGYTGTSLIDALNAAADYYILRDYSHWLLNKGKNAVSFTINKNSPFKLNTQIILLPSLASEGKVSFDGWYTDDGLTTPLTGYEVTSETELYGSFEENTNKYTISFDTRREGVSVAPITAQFGSVVTLPSDLKSDGCIIGMWETENGDYIGSSLAMPSHNITLYAAWKCTHIETPEDFIAFSKVVNNGVDSFIGTTVFLDSDLSLAGKSFEPIGDYYNHFSGTFDGQGHVISNLTMTSSSDYVGLFGYSKGLTIKNVILDSSCSITSSFIGFWTASIGGIIGYCEAEDGPCTIENSVNMGSVTLGGSIDYSLRLGGIAGELYSSYHNDIVKNCANYGDVTHSGESRDSHIGGIVGQSNVYSSATRVYIYNCFNHGTITHNGTTSDDLYLGGIAGYTYAYAKIENCVSGGKILSTKGYIGSIVVGVSSNTYINYCYFTNELSRYNKYERGTPSESNTFSYKSTTFELNGTVSIEGYTGTSLIEALNAAADYYALRDYSHWLLNKGKNAVTFTVNGRSNPIKMNYQIILLPSLASEGNMKFDGWYTDNGLTTPLTEFEVTKDTELYGKYCGPNFTVTLDVNGGDELAVKEMTIGCVRVYGDLPTPTRTEATFLGWFNERTGGDKIKSGGKVIKYNNHTLYAHWSINKYTLTFVFNNGTEPEVRVLDFNEAITYPADPVRAGYTFTGWDKNITNMPAENTTITAQWRANNYTVTFNPSGGSVSQATKVVTFESTYGVLPTPNRTGHTFLGWFSEKNVSITGESIVNIPNDHTLYAHWLEATQGQVEIVFNAKDMSKEEIEETIRKYTDADFKIIVTEITTDEVRVIVEFVDAEEANEFVRKVNAAIEKGEWDKIKRVDFVQGTPSFSPAHHPTSLLFLF